jgi:long-chain fatty acid transport protein
MPYSAVFYAFIFLLISSISHASGFDLRGQGAGGYGKLGATVATVNDASAVFYNPAALAKLTRAELYLGGALINSSFSYISSNNETLNTTTSVGAPQAIPHLHFAYPVSESLALGLGIFAPHGSTIEWPTHHPQSSVGITRTLQTTAISSAIAATFNDLAPGLKGAFSFDFTPARYETIRQIPYGQNNGTAHTHLSGVGFRTKFSLLYDPEVQPNIHMGITWRTPLRLQLKGETDFDSSPEHRASLPPDGSTTLDMELPQNLIVGIAYDATPDLSLEVNLEWGQYSVHSEEVLAWNDGTESTSPKEWKDTVSVRAGLSLKTALAQLRAGYELSTTPVPLKTLNSAFPDANRQSFSAGAGFAFIDGFFFDIAGVYLLPVSRRASQIDYQPLHKATYEIASVEIIASIGAYLN